MVRFFVLIIFLLIPITTFSQIGGTSSFRFLDMSMSAKELSLANAITLKDSSLESALSNPSTINSQHGGKIMLNYEPYFEGIHRGTLAYALSLNREKAILFDINYINYGDFNGYDEFGNSIGKFTGNETSVGISSSHYFLKPNLYLGAKLKFILSHLDIYSSSAIATDIGVFYESLKNDICFSILFRNFGKQITAYQDVYEPLPTNLSLGFSNQLKYLPLRYHLTLHHLNKWPLSFNNPVAESYSLSNNNFKNGFFKKVLSHSTFGVELFPEGSFNLRLGYHSQRSSELRILGIRNFSGMSFGVGFNVRRFNFQVSHSRYSVAGNRTFFGFTITPKNG